MVRVKHDKPRGILNARAASGLQRYWASSDLAPFIEHYWIVRWNFAEPVTAETLPHPSVHMVLSDEYSEIVGVMRGRFSRTLQGVGRVVGTKFRPGAFRAFVDRPVVSFTDRRGRITGRIADHRNITKVEQLAERSTVKGVRMRKVILQEFVSLDGLASGPKDSVDFVPASNKGDESFGRKQMTFVRSIDAIVLGRKTYQMFASYWPNVTKGEDKELAAKINTIPKFVFSRTLDEAPWGKFEPATIVKGNAAKEVAKLKRARGKDIVIWGSLSLAQSLLKHGAIDEVELIVCPVVLGKGRSLFDRATEMKLLKTQSYDRGSVRLTYEPSAK